MTEPTRILLIGGSVPPIGGTRVSFKQLMDDLSQRDDVRIWTLKIPPLDSPATSLWWTVRTFWRMAYLVPRVDVVSLHATSRATYVLGPTVWFLCRVFRKRSVLRRFGGSFHQRFDQLPAIPKWIVKRTVLDMDLLLFQTREMVEYFRKVTSKPVEWFPTNRPPLSDVDGLDIGKSKERVRKFVFVGHVAPRKGVREIIKASSQVEEDIVVDVYGPLRDGLTADEFDGQKTVYHGILPPESVIATLRRYDVLLLPTYHLGEGYPGVILESYCAGIPVIATRWNAIPEIVDQTSGILVEPGDVGGLRDAMLRLIRSPAEYAKLQIGAKEKALQFSSEVWTEKFVELVVGL